MLVNVQSRILQPSHLTLGEMSPYTTCGVMHRKHHGDTGAGLGASHQTGRTGVIARALHLFATTTAEQALERGKYAPAAAGAGAGAAGAHRMPDSKFRDTEPDTEPVTERKGDHARESSQPAPANPRRRAKQEEH